MMTSVTSVKTNMKPRVALYHFASGEENEKGLTLGINWFVDAVEEKAVSTEKLLSATFSLKNTWRLAEVKKNTNMRTHGYTKSLANHFSGMERNRQHLLLTLSSELSRMVRAWMF